MLNYKSKRYSPVEAHDNFSKIYVLWPPLSDAIWRHGISFYSFPDDTEPYVAVLPDDNRPNDALSRH